MDLELKDKVVVITGGSEGIGLGVARGFAREGAQLVITARTKAEIEKAATDIRAEYGVKVTPSPGMYRQPMAATPSSRWPTPPAGPTSSSPTPAQAPTRRSPTPDEKWDHFWNLHVMAAVRISRALALQMEKKGGDAMISIASIFAVQPSTYEPIYNTTKAALMMFSKCLSNELISKNICVNTVNPGLIRTPDWESRAQPEHQGANWQTYLDDKLAPIKRFASVDEVADFCVYLSSPRASYFVDSAPLHIDGGWLNTV